MHATDIAVPGAVAMSQLKIGSCECEIVRGTALDSNRSAKSRGVQGHCVQVTDRYFISLHDSPRAHRCRSTTQRV